MIFLRASSFSQSRKYIRKSLISFTLTEKVMHHVLHEINNILFCSFLKFNLRKFSKKNRKRIFLSQKKEEISLVTLFKQFLNLKFNETLHLKLNETINILLLIKKALNQSLTIDLSFPRRPTTTITIKHKKVALIAFQRFFSF